MLNDKQYRISALADHDMRQYTFERNSRLPAGYFDAPRWYKNPDTIVFWVVLICGLAAAIWAQ